MVCNHTWTICLTTDLRFSCVCTVIDHEFRHNIVKVAVDLAEWIYRLNDNVMTKFIDNKGTDEWKTWRHLVFFFTITNSQTVNSRLLTHCINHTSVSVCIWKLAYEQARISPVIVQTYIVMKTEKKHNLSQNPTTQTARSPSDNHIVTTSNP